MTNRIYYDIYFLPNTFSLRGQYACKIAYLEPKDTGLKKTTAAA